MSSFAAVSAVLAGNLGTGNLAGVAVGLSVGGPGVIVWMWLIAILGAGIRFVSCFLGVKYQSHVGYDIYVGGPMYYMLHGLNRPWLAKLFCVVTLLSALTAGNITQINSAMLPVQNHWPGQTLLILILLLLAFCVLYNRRNVFVKIVVSCVPFMTCVYVSICLLILFSRPGATWQAIQLIVQSTFSMPAAVGGLLGYGVIDIIRVGFERGVLACDIGTGVAAIIHAQVKSDQSLPASALQQGLAATTAPFMVMVFCTMTALVLLVSGVSQTDFESTNLCIHAFHRATGSDLVKVTVVLVLWLFAFTTVLTWDYCAQTAFKFLFKNVPDIVYKMIFITCIPLGFFVPVHLAWLSADLALSFMFTLNVFSCFYLFKQVLRDLKAVSA